MGLFFQEGGSDSPAKAREIENQREAAITNGVRNISQSFRGFNNAYYHKRAQDYINYAMPMLGEQTRAAQKNLVYSLADRGLTRSSVASEKQAELGQLTSNAQASVVDEGNAKANALRLGNENQRNTLIEQLIAAQNPQLAKEGVLGSAAGIQLPNNSQSTMELIKSLVQSMQAVRLNEQAGQRGSASYKP